MISLIRVSLLRLSSISESKEISSRLVRRLSDIIQTKRKAIWPPLASIHVNCSMESFSTIWHTVSSQEPQLDPCGRKLESQKVTIAKASKSMDCPANPVKQKLRTFACCEGSARSRRLSASFIPPLPETSCTSRKRIRATSYTNRNPTIATLSNKKSRRKVTIGTRIPGSGINENNSMRPKPRSPPSSIYVLCNRYSGSSRTRSEWVNMSGATMRINKEMRVLTAMKGMTKRLSRTTWATSC